MQEPAAAGGRPDGLGELEREVLCDPAAHAWARRRRPRASRAEVLAEMRVLEERIAQQKRMLEASEEELARMIQEKSVDPGVASLYRTVQGLDPARARLREEEGAPER